MFTEKQEKMIFQIINLFKEDKFKQQRVAVYSKKPDMLNPLEMYVIEEIYRLESNNYFNTLKNIKLEDKNIIDEYNTFMNKCRKDFNFELDKVNEYYKKVNSLNDLEKFCISLILKNKDKKEILDKMSKYEYDDLYEIKCSTDDEIKETIANITLGIMIDHLLKKDNNYNIGIKQRQLKKGVFSNLDKDYIISVINREPTSKKVIDFSVNNLYPIAKMYKETESGIDIFNSTFKTDVNIYITNITVKETFNLKSKEKGKKF